MPPLPLPPKTCVYHGLNVHHQAFFPRNPLQFFASLGSSSRKRNPSGVVLFPSHTAATRGTDTHSSSRCSCCSCCVPLLIVDHSIPHALCSLFSVRCSGKTKRCHRVSQVKHTKKRRIQEFKNSSVFLFFFLLILGQARNPKSKRL